jgi:hypothetical protein
VIILDSTFCHSIKTDNTTCYQEQARYYEGVVGFSHSYPEGAVKVKHPETIKLNSSKFKSFSINRVLAQFMHVDLNHTLYHLELNAVEKSDGHCKKKVGGFKECYFQAT